MDETNLLEGIDLDLPEFGNDDPQRATAHDKALIDGPGNSLERQFLGPYELISRIGQGGVAIVYRARHMHPNYSDKSLALKVLHEHLSADVRVNELFRREARVLSLIKHANVVETFEAGVQDGRMFLVMEYVDGRDLENLLWRTKQLQLTVPQPVYLHIVAEVLRGLGYAHHLKDFNDTALGVVHRDVNPANVFLAFDGRVKLGDFGVTSVLSETNKKQREVAGKVGYFAPEQLIGEAPTASSDLFAVGVMLFEILCGRRLFDADSSEAAMRLNAAAKVPDMHLAGSGISQGLVEITLRALAKKPQDRYKSAQEMLAALSPYLSERRVMTLALRSLMRSAFVLDHGRELTLQRRLQGHAKGQGRKQVVDIVAKEPEARDALTQLLQREDYAPRSHNDAESLYRAQAHHPGKVVLWGLNSDDVPEGHSPKAALPAASIVAMGRSLDTHTLQWACLVGAQDLLFRPLPQERVLNAVRAAMDAAPRAASTEGAPLPRKLRMLVISQNHALCELIRDELCPQGYQVAVAKTLDEALLGVHLRSFELCIIDLHLASPLLSVFIEAYRGAKGMGMVPMLLLAHDGPQWAVPSLPERTHVAWAKGPFIEAIDSVLRAGANGNSRTFERYDVRFDIKVRFGGRVFDAEAINASRGGLLLHTAQLPSINTELGLIMHLPDNDRVEAQGTALRVLLGRERNDSHNGARIGIALRTFFGDGEGRYIRFIAALAENADAPRSASLSRRARGWLQGLQSRQR